MVGIKVQIDPCLFKNLTAEPAFLLGTMEPPRILSLVRQIAAPPETTLHAWVTEHARMLRSMCLGGIAVVGMYAPGSGNNATTTADIDVAASMARRVVVLPADVRTNALSGSLVLYKSAKGRPAVKLVPTGAGVAIRSADLRVTPGLLDSVVVLSGQVSLTGVAVSQTDRASDAELLCVSSAEALSPAAVLTVRDNAGQMSFVSREDDDRVLASLIGWSVPSTSKKKASFVPTLSPQQVDINFPVASFATDPEELPDTATVPSLLKYVALSGTMHVSAVVVYESLAGEALRAIRDDINRSIRSRVDLLRELDSENDENLSTGERPLPVRIIATPVQSSSSPMLPMTDYMVDNASIDDETTSHFAEILSWSNEDLENTHFEQLEKPATIVKTDSNLPAPTTEKNLPPPISEIELIDVDEGPPQVVVQSVLVAVILAIFAIILRQFL